MKANRANSLDNGRAIAAVHAPTIRTASKFGDRQRMGLGTGEPAGPQMAMSPIGILLSKDKLKALGDAREFFASSNSNRIGFQLNKTNAQINSLSGALFRGIDYLHGLDGQLIAFAIQRQPRLYQDLPGFRRDFQARDDSKTMKRSIVPLGLFNDILLFLGQVICGEKLAREEVRAFDS